MNDGDLISRKALEEALERTNIRLGFDKSRMFALIENAPAADAVEVVKCKDCKHMNRNDESCECCEEINDECGVCLHTWNCVSFDGFCSIGERRSDV